MCMVWSRGTVSVRVISVIPTNGLVTISLPQSRLAAEAQIKIAVNNRPYLRAGMCVPQGSEYLRAMPTRSDYVQHDQQRNSTDKHYRCARLRDSHFIPEKVVCGRGGNKSDRRRCSDGTRTRG